MKINFYNPLHHIVEKSKAQEGMLSLNLKDVTYVLANSRPGESLVYYKDGTTKFVGNSIGEKILKFINKMNIK